MRYILRNCHGFTDYAWWVYRLCLTGLQTVLDGFTDFAWRVYRLCLTGLQTVLDGLQTVLDGFTDFAWRVYRLLDGFTDFAWRVYRLCLTGFQTLLDGFTDFAWRVYRHCLTGLQTMLDKLRMYCKQCKRTTDISETMIVVFLKNTTFNETEKWVYNGETIETGLFFKYNGNVPTHSVIEPVSGAKLYLPWSDRQISKC